MTTEFVKANQLMRRHCYSEALSHYYSALECRPMMAEIIKFNIKIAEKRICKKTKILNPHEIKLANFSVISFSNIVIQETSGCFLALNDDPSIIINPVTNYLTQNNWYLFKTKISFEQKKATSKLYFDNGVGFNELDSVNLQIFNDLQSERIFFVDKNLNGLRYDPIDLLGKFEILQFDIEKLSRDDAKNLMLKKVCENLNEFENCSIESAWLKLIEEANEEQVKTLEPLYKVYSKTFLEKPNRIDYEEWMENVEKPSLPSFDNVFFTIQRMKYRPLISIVLPVYNIPEKYLRACIDSVLAQLYPDWELCIADDKSPDPEVCKILDEYQKKDTRIRVAYRSNNGNISAASNTALQLATGDFVALLDHDDELTPHALYFMAHAINDHPQVQILYSDEDKIDNEGNRFEPHFKSDWNPDLFHSQNYVCHLGLYKRDLLNRIKGFRLGLEGSQDHDLILRCLTLVEAKHIVHVPRILYHWRAVDGSTALASAEKDYTTKAGLRALRDYFAALNSNTVQVEAGQLPNTYRVRWPIPNSPPQVSLLIPTRDRKNITEIAVQSILDKTTYSNYEILILDNGSVEPETLEWFSFIQKLDPRVKVLRYDHPFNYSAINNFGIKHASGEIVGLVNNDVEVINSDWLTEMVRHAIRPDIGCVGAKLYYSDGRIQHAGVILGIGGVAGHSHKYFPSSHHGYFSRLKLVQSLSAVTAACLVVRKDVYIEVGGLDELNLTVAFNDVDFCLKVREAGYRNLWTPYAELYHHESISRGVEDSIEKQQRFRMEVEVMKSRWAEQLNSDPYYSPNLTLEHEDFSMKQSVR